jgi:hypothetical protein
MNVKRNVMIAGAIATVGIASLGSLGVASAQSNSSNDSLVDKIATKFNLNKEDVQTVVDEYHKDRQTERQAELSERLQQAVDSGDITSEQKTLIENKHKELSAERDEQMKALDAWAEQNNIDMKYLHGGKHGKNNNQLQQAVESGKITSEQKASIENKRQELEDARDTLKDELDQWAEDNDIDQKYIMFGHGSPGGPGPKGRGGEF